MFLFFLILLQTVRSVILSVAKNLLTRQIAKVVCLRNKFIFNKLRKMEYRYLLTQEISRFARNDNWFYFYLILKKSKLIILN